MGKIKVLDIQTANRIAAGEVVERPASVVKELCENSIDANAKRISITVEGGGVRFIRITDNGFGMSKDDAKKAVLAHATSKLKTIQDLDTLQSMGFRGEALASIASVSKFKIITRTKEDDTAYFLDYEGGHLIKEGSVAQSVGTTIEVSSLFFNTPARYKFLKKDATELAQIHKVVSALALAHPSISFRLMNGNQELLHSPGNNDFFSACYSLYGAKITNALIELPKLMVGSIQVSGFLGLPESARKSRSHEFFFVNRRTISSPTLLKAVEDAYSTFLMTRRFPVVYLFLELPPNLLDVNVHPQKKELRFWNESEVYKAVYHAVKNRLTEAISISPLEADGTRVLPAREFVVTTNQEGSNANLKGSEFKESTMPTFSYAEPSSKGDKEAEEHKLQIQDDFVQKPKSTQFSQLMDNVLNTYDLKNSAEAFDLEHQSKNSEIIEESVTEEPQTVQLSFAEGLGYVSPEDNSVQKNISLQKTQFQEEKSKELIPKDPWLAKLLTAPYLCSLFSTYLLFQLDDEIVAIDQHAAHEKILYERLKDQYDTQGHLPSQMLLHTELIRLDASELVEFKSIAPKLQEKGFEFDFLDEGSVALRAVPIDLAEKNPALAFREILDELLSQSGRLGALDSDAFDTDHMLATMACKAAVKAHDYLSPSEVRQLIRDLVVLKHPYHCPHGRPVLVRIPESRIEKAFKRIV